MNYDANAVEHIINAMEMILPYKVYDILSDSSPDSEGPLMLISAAFINKEDADKYASMKTEETGRKHVVKTLQSIS